MRTFSIIIVLLLSAAVFAQGAAVVEKAPKNFEKALKSENGGLVESAIFLSLKFKIFYPEQDCRGMVKQIERLAREGRSKSTRYKAYLAAEFLNHENLLGKIAREDYKDAGGFFKMLAGELENEALVTRE